MGELSARALMVKGTKGYLMDGHCGDVEEIIDAVFQFFAGCQLCVLVEDGNITLLDNLSL